MQLHDLTKLLLTASLIGDGETVFTDIENDSRSVKPGQLFLCVPGLTVDGHIYADEAVRRGAVAIVTEKVLEIDVPQLVVRDSRLAMAVIADYVYAHPSERVRLIGVTGTNGKTTTTYLIEKIFNDRLKATGVIGTIEWRYADKSYPMKGTTPDALELQRQLGEMRDANIQYCAMEVSSHALEQGRVKGCRFRTAIFTNLTQDHLDFHGSMEQYAAAKGLFFSRLGNAYSKSMDERSYAVLNSDDPASRRYSMLTAAEVITFGVEQEADVRASQIRISPQGTFFHVESFRGCADIQLKLAGKFNVYNALAAIAAALIEGIELSDIKRSLESIPGVPGRVESVDEGQNFSVIVDYAHTPDGLDNVLRAVNEIAENRIICVFGCGGDRDRTKRPIMGRIAAQCANYIIVTSDNPRTEDAELIIRDIEVGLKEVEIDTDNYALIPDRKAAIQKAVEMASPGDVVLIAGKGHETYQLIGGDIYPFDDRIVAKEAIRRLLQ
ncbi:UDP-N-acetylmuramoyl-L-alanyl-D-glutamate--2,6-diaminopimelate ligase [Paenibacillus sp. GSMTC-2017]|uniref:UDP-N-acetylmuramoyl-L-alanyl-D-glutamate--2, 6-diaminopimelate ligase n=1 Tax=Paenibacillus sp. GSMTC-2017 TaxID=2794350 RepID=UPI0018DA027A|nr:UDP-N-acetylmuramoyl-L-alanyl-D-glutamate--2,6-diaminopimelate ligase [Paenibacillus sp. GSMTC-2017]MBH5316905.1 UDP-N-acetylmuramoyl-L-alanyl-D-glutamate--2,6-diaminopimelate ligase [Paenibacillus sp. GSMTC-2017]